MSGDVARAAWNSTYEKGLVEVLHMYKDNAKYKGQNSWTSEGWRIITTKFNEMLPFAHFTKQQLQEKEKEVKANYKAVTDAKKESGNGWNEALRMINVEPEIWKKLIKNHLRVARFRKKPFPLFYCLEALYEGSVATGDLNFTSTQQVAPVPTLVPDPTLPPPPATAPPLPAPAAPLPVALVERSNSKQSLHLGTNPFASSFDVQETSSALNEPNEAQSTPSNQDSRQGEGGGGKKM